MKTLLTIFAAILLAFPVNLKAAGKERGEFKSKGEKPWNTKRHVSNGLFYTRVKFPEPHYKPGMETRTPIWAKEELKSRYVYFPKMDMFYDSYTDAFIYTDEAAWVASALLTQEFSLIRLHNAEQIQVNSIAPSPKAFLEFYGTGKKHA
jgi:hypothetical protein